MPILPANQSFNYFSMAQAEHKEGKNKLCGLRYWRNHGVVLFGVRMVFLNRKQVIILKKVYGLHCLGMCK
jgi:hypothetical protein